MQSLQTHRLVEAIGLQYHTLSIYSCCFFAKAGTEGFQFFLNWEINKSLLWYTEIIIYAYYYWSLLTTKYNSLRITGKVCWTKAVLYIYWSITMQHTATFKAAFLSKVNSGSPMAGKHNHLHRSTAEFASISITETSSFATNVCIRNICVRSNNEKQQRCTSVLEIIAH